MADASKSWLAGRWVAVLFFLWTLAGLAAFAMQWTQDLTELAKTDPYQAETFAKMPAWAWAVYGVAVVTGAIGALLLILRNKLAVTFSGIEVIAVIVQFGYTIGMTDLIAVRGIVTAAAFPAVIILLAILQFLYARWMAARGLLS